MKNTFILVMLLGTQVFASYDFTTTATKVATKLQDGTPLQNASYDYLITAQKLEIPCVDDFSVTGYCWMARSIDSGILTTDVTGTATLPAKHYTETSMSWKQSAGHPVIMNFSGITLPFTDKNGNARQCFGVQGYTLQNAKITFDVKTADDGTQDFIIDADQQTYGDFVNTMITNCQDNVDRYTSDPVMPY